MASANQVTDGVQWSKSKNQMIHNLLEAEVDRDFPLNPRAEKEQGVWTLSLVDGVSTSFLSLNSYISKKVWNLQEKIGVQWVKW